MNLLKYAEHKTFCICIQAYKIHAGDDFDEMYEVLYTLKLKVKIDKILIEKKLRDEWKSWFRTRLLFKNSKGYI